MENPLTKLWELLRRNRKVIRNLPPLRMVPLDDVRAPQKPKEEEHPEKEHET